MPGTYKPTTTYYPNGVVSIETADRVESYDALQASFVSYFYHLLKYYCKAASNAQLMLPLEFREYDANGNQLRHPLIIAIDPAQFQSAIDLQMEEYDITFNGQYYYYATLLPLQQIYVIFDVREAAATYRLPPGMFGSEFFRNFKNSL